MKKFNLQLFADGGQGGSEGSQGGSAGAGNGGQSSTGNGTFSFAQAEEIANARAERAEKSALSSYFKQQGMSEEEVTQALKDYKANKEKNKPNVDKITIERDNALRELNTLKNEKVLTSKGVKAEDMDYVQFKIGKLMEEDDKLDFTKATEKFLKENPRYTQGTYRVKTGSDNSQGSGSSTGDNTSINDAIRRAARR